MKQSVLLISNSTDFMFKVLTAGLSRAGIDFLHLPADPSVSEQAGKAHILILYLDEGLARDEAFLTGAAGALSEQVLYLIGNKEELENARRILPEGAVQKSYVRPVNIRDLTGDILALEKAGGEQAGRPRILVVDDEPTQIRVTSRVLSDEYKVFVAGSGSNAITFLKRETVDLILMDIRMPDMDGFETLSKVREIPGREEIPVIFLTGLNDGDVELKGLQAGAADFITKPFLPEVLKLRVRNYLELERLRDDLTLEVKKKTEEVVRQQDEIRHLTFQIVETLSGTIDAKDKYTNGHSVRVGTYAEEIARRAGFPESECARIYMIGLLHDVGKIGIPDQIINKTSRLTDEEYAIIKTHPVIGAGILKNITVLPHIADGARWHHERYDGKGYPDGLKGEEIPKIAQIIGVADAYDAMTSNRSYRFAMEQKQVRLEIEKGKGTQFAPQYADIMLQMIDEDTEYAMRETYHAKRNEEQE